MRTTFRRALVAITGALLLIAGMVPAQAASDRGEEARSEHQRIVDFWTPARVAQAVPRDFEFDPATGEFRQVPVPSRRPSPSPSPTPTSPPDSWTGATGKGTVQETTGKVLFALGRSYYVCSASVIPDRSGEVSLVMTAAHCVFDWNRGGRFATNWMFIPNYDAQPAPLDTSRTFCSQTKYGCWTASALVIDSGFASAGRFNTQATLHDYAVAVVGPGGKTNPLSQLDTAVGTQQVSFTDVDGDTGTDPDTYLFGYPAADPYTGKDLIYSFSDIGFDPNNGGQTYRAASTMTGGSSGGPWFQPFTEGTGTQISVNSYGYTGLPYMHGPIFNANTEAVVSTATSATGNTIVTVAP